MGELVVEGAKVLAGGDAIGAVGFALFVIIISILRVGILCQVYNVALLKNCLRFLAIGMMAARGSGMGGSLVGRQHGVECRHVLVGIEETGREVQGCFFCCGSSRGDLLLEPSWSLMTWKVMSCYEESWGSRTLVYASGSFGRHVVGFCIWKTAFDTRCRGTLAQKE